MIPTQPNERPAVPHRIDSQWALASALQNMTKRLRPAVNAAYKTDDYETRVALAKDALPWAESVLAAIRYAATPPDEGVESTSTLCKPEPGRDEDWVGAVVIEKDPRNPESAMKKIVQTKDGYAHCRAGRQGMGRWSRVRIDRLYTARYTLYAHDLA